MTPLVLDAVHIPIDYIAYRVPHKDIQPRIGVPLDLTERQGLRMVHLAFAVEQTILANEGFAKHLQLLVHLAERYQ